MIFDNFEELQDVCDDCKLSNEGLVCWNTCNPTYTRGISWGKCNLNDCPLLEHEVTVSVYINGEELKNITITAIKYS